MKFSRIIAMLGALAITCAALAADVGGIPSRPQFASVGIGTTAPGGTGLSIVAAPGADLTVQAKGSASTAYIQFEAVDSTSMHYADLCLNLAADACGPGETIDDGALQIASSANLRIDYGGSSWLMPKVSAGHFTTTGSSCTIAPSTAHFLQNIASCVRNSAGNYSVNFSLAYAAAPDCTTSYYANGSPLATVDVVLSNTTTTGANVQVFISGALGDGLIFQFQCVGV
ncbi:MAG: hypothetical protein ACRD1F_01740 [Terriglobales bacterium]